MSGSSNGSPPAQPASSIPISRSPSRLPSNLGTSPRTDATARLASIPRQSVTRSDQTPNAGTPAEPNSTTPLAGAATRTTAGPGVSALAAALSQSYGGSPPRFGTPPIRVQSPSARSNLLGTSPTPPISYGSFDVRSIRNGEGQAPYEDLETIKKHLVQPSDTAATSDSAVGKLPSKVSDHGKGKKPSGQGDEDDEEFSSLRLQGGDITRPIYKWTEENENKLQRSKSFSVSRPAPEDEVLDINNIKVPGGFRRNYLRRVAASPMRGADGLESGHGHVDSPKQGNQLFTNSFLEFLSVYGHFAGEDLEEDDEVLKPGEYFSSGEDEWDSGEDSGDDDREPMEDSTLLTPSRRKRRKLRSGTGKASPVSAALVLLKSFVGTGVLFLPRAYLNGGMIFSNVVLLGVAALCYYCFVLLVTARLAVPGSFGDIGNKLYGRWMRDAILLSIVLSQVGFVAAYMVFVSENLRAFILAVSDCATNIDIKWIILVQAAIFLPFSLFRDINKLSFTALIADVFIVLGLGYLFYYDVFTIAKFGLADIVPFNQRDWTLFIGVAIFTFEGIGLIIPIQESMAEPRKFPRVLFAVMIIITTLFTVMGAISYAAWGSKTETVVLLNLPQDSKLVNGVQFLYSLAIMLSTPLQMFPAIRILENGLFTRSGKYNPYIKWQKNAFRFFFVIACACIAWGGADDLDKFVALVGNFACIPLVFIYPAMLHYKSVAKTRFARWSDIVLCCFGFLAMAYTTAQTIRGWASGPAEALPGYCDRRQH